MNAGSRQVESGLAVPGVDRSFFRRLLFLCFILSASPDFQAHQFSESYLEVTLEGRTLGAHWDIAVRDLAHVMTLAPGADQSATWDGLAADPEVVDTYVQEHLKFKINDIARSLSVTNRSVRLFVDGPYAVVEFEVISPIEVYSVEVEYSAILDQDPQHRCIYMLQSPAGEETGILNVDQRAQRFELAKPDRWRQFLEFTTEGLWHIWKGIDHVLFLVALLLPSVLVREGGRWSGVQSFRHAFLDVLKIVTAFTVAHSVTLSMASLGWVRLPSRPVEAVIALSVAVAAGNNLVPFFRGRAWLIAFGFGLVHGFGFATVLQELGLPPGSLARALVGFNIGVEAGQLAIVAVFLPLAYVLRRSWFYRTGLCTVGSAGIVLVAAAWMVDRVFVAGLMPF